MCGGGLRPGGVCVLRPVQTGRCVCVGGGGVEIRPVQTGRCVCVCGGGGGGGGLR